MNRLSQHSHTLALVLQRIAQSPFSNLLTVLVIGVTLSLPLGLYALFNNLARIGGNIPAEPQITLFLSRSAAGADIRQLQTQLQSHPAVKRVTFVARDEALKELLASSGLQDLAGTLEHNPLPDAFIVQPRSNNPQALEKLVDEARGWPRVETAQLDSAWARRLYVLLELGRRAVMILGAILGVALLGVISNTTRLQILTRREEIEVSQLIGATDGFIRRPFLYFGAIEGLAGGVVALGVVAAGLHVLDSGAANLAQLYGASFSLRPPSLPDCAALLAIAAALGWTGAWIAVTRHLRGSQNT